MNKVGRAVTQMVGYMNLMGVFVRNVGWNMHTDVPRIGCTKDFALKDKDNSSTFLCI
jgi:hypothetical protein